MGKGLATRHLHSHENNVPTGTEKCINTVSLITRQMGTIIENILCIHADSLLIPNF